MDSKNKLVVARGLGGQVESDCLIDQGFYYGVIK